MGALIFLGIIAVLFQFAALYEWKAHKCKGGALSYSITSVLVLTGLTVHYFRLFK